MSRVTIKTLRKDLPMWSWTAHRHGFGGWYYVGERACARVEVRSYAELCGPSDDDFATTWRASEGGSSESFAMFWLRWAKPESGILGGTESSAECCEAPDLGED